MEMMLKMPKITKCQHDKNMENAVFCIFTV